MTSQIDRHDIEDGLYVYLQSNSKRWYCRFVLHGKWYSRTTKEKVLEKAVAQARVLKIQYETKYENNILVSSKSFKDVAAKTIERFQLELDNDTGKVSYKDYIQALNKYHIPFFGRIYVTSIDQDKIREFEKWRFEQNGRQLAKSTLLTHNAALNMVFKEAIDSKWMIAAQVPSLTSKAGTSGGRRAAFREDEYYKVLHTIEEMKDNSRKEVTRQIRELLESYVDFVVQTGIRPGTEMEALTWGDIEMKRQDNKVRFLVYVRKGKTTKHTGTRKVVCRDDIWGVLEELRDRFPNRKPSDKIFRLANGDTTNELGVTFRKALEVCELKNSPDGPRTLYSLRHTYITWQLLKKDLRIDILAKQCGTSTAMIEQHYSHVVPSMFEEELSGVKFDEKPKKSTSSIRKLWNA
ncbi:tyrosine-type recombinase/integrase [Psychrosphaera algicola]|uniref:Site-specific integrase n=1 Tax=Psychrosphaera algicola TaxID=3023714 RepID=A0ABT5FBR8_9GAMM|nr:site-specific integrase [Psychrosphaera sp. G1-22]MDC2888989.1 site-specific integrase [Psychrosphaera sp. G1-22]